MEIYRLIALASHKPSCFQLHRYRLSIRFFFIIDFEKMIRVKIRVDDFFDLIWDVGSGWCCLMLHWIESDWIRCDFVKIWRYCHSFKIKKILHSYIEPFSNSNLPIDFWCPNCVLTYGCVGEFFVTKTDLKIDILYTQNTHQHIHK